MQRTVSSVTPPKINRKDAKALCGLGGFAVKKNSLPFSSSVVTERSWAIPLKIAALGRAKALAEPFPNVGGST